MCGKIKLKEFKDVLDTAVKKEKKAAFAAVVGVAIFVIFAFFIMKWTPVVVNKFVSNPLKLQVLRRV